MDTVSLGFDSIPGFLELMGVVVFAASGAIAAGRKSLDLLGVMVVATVAAIGGGTIRDVLLNRDPIFWIHEPLYLLVIWIAALVTVLYTKVRRPPNKSLLVVDAIGLAFFSIAGAQIAEARGVDGVIIVLMGTITGSAGGMLRDILVNEIPLVMRRGNFYTTASILGITLYMILQGIGVPREIASVLGMFGVVALRVVGFTWALSLPVYRLQWEEEVRKLEEGKETDPREKGRNGKDRKEGPSPERD